MNQIKLHFQVEHSKQGQPLQQKHWIELLCGKYEVFLTFATTSRFIVRTGRKQFFEVKLYLAVDDLVT